MVHCPDDTMSGEDPRQSYVSIAKSPFAFLIFITYSVISEEPSSGLGQLIVTERPLNIVSGFLGVFGF